MHHPILEGRGADLAPFGLVDVEMPVDTRTVAGVVEGLLELDQVVGQLMLEHRRTDPSTLAQGGFAVGIQQVAPVDDALEGWAMVHGLWYFQEALFDAQSQGGSTRKKHLREADAALNKLRLYLRLVHRLRWLNDGQYQYVSAMAAELGRLLGSWIKVANGGKSDPP